MSLSVCFLRASGWSKLNSELYTIRQFTEQIKIVAYKHVFFFSLRIWQELKIQLISWEPGFFQNILGIENTTKVYVLGLIILACIY